MNKPKKIDAVNLMFEIDKLLIELLESLSPDDWEKQTIAPKWKVKDVAVHLLDGNLRHLSMLRDGYFGEKPEEINSYQDLIDFFNRLNADWVKATKRLSPKVIIDLLKVTGKETCEFIATLNPDDKAVFSVAWAGENESKNWFHIAREYTEKWHHQQQIRFAVGREKDLLRNKWFLPYLDTSVRALPHHYRDVDGENMDLIKFTFIGESEYSWFLLYENSWKLLTDTNLEPKCEVIIKNEYAWKIFTKGMKRDEAIKASKIIGNETLGKKIFDLIAVMA